MKKLLASPEHSTVTMSRTNKANISSVDNSKTA